MINPSPPPPLKSGLRSYDISERVWPQELGPKELFKYLRKRVLSAYL